MVSSLELSTPGTRAGVVWCTTIEEAADVMLGEFVVRGKTPGALYVNREGDLAQYASREDHDTGWLGIRASDLLIQAMRWDESPARVWRVQIPA